MLEVTDSVTCQILGNQRTGVEKILICGWVGGGVFLLSSLLTVHDLLRAEIYSLAPQPPTTVH